MSQAIQAVVHDRHVVITVPDSIPDGTRVEVNVVPITEQIGLSESQWRTDAEAIKDWNDWLPTIEQVDFAQPDDFDHEFQKFNVQAVREQMFGSKQ